MSGKRELILEDFPEEIACGLSLSPGAICIYVCFCCCFSFAVSPQFLKASGKKKPPGVQVLQTVVRISVHLAVEGVLITCIFSKELVY